MLNRKAWSEKAKQAECAIANYYADRPHKIPDGSFAMNLLLRYAESLHRQQKKLWREMDEAADMPHKGRSKRKQK